MNDIKPILEWAKQYGESKIVERLLVKLLPEILKTGEHLTPELIESRESILVDETFYQLIKTSAEEMVGARYEG